MAYVPNGQSSTLISFSSKHDSHDALCRYGAGGSSTLGRGKIPTVGCVNRTLWKCLLLIPALNFGRIIPQPDYLWAAQTDGGWSKMDLKIVVSQINVILRLISSLDEKFLAGAL
jgi:hypothetical protein